MRGTKAVLEITKGGNMLLANQIDFKNGFKKHFHAYNNWGNAGSTNSRNLILCYCVECGLKFLFLQKIRIYEIKNLSKDQMDKFKTHNIESLITLVGVSGSYRFKLFKSKYDESITSENYHQLCRYCIPVKDELESTKAEDFQTNLIKIASWLSERVI